MLISNPKNIFYLTGFSPSIYHREAFLFLSSKNQILFHSPLNTPSEGLEIESIALDGKNKFVKTINSVSSKEVYIESDDMSVSEFNNLKNKIDKNIIHSTKIIENLRIIKDDQEIKQIKKACDITQKTWEEIKHHIIPGITEKQIQNLIISTLLKNGADEVPADFLPIVASGVNSTFPHHIPTKKIIQKDDVVLVDFGCKINGYYSDMSRTISLSPSPIFNEVEQIVKNAYRLGTNIDKDSTNNQIDEKIKKIINQSKYKNTMIHTAGHGVGLDIHEAPSLSAHAPTRRISSKMVLAIEPAIYIPNQFGYRYENTLLIDQEKAISLTGE